MDWLILILAGLHLPEEAGLAQGLRRRDVESLNQLYRFYSPLVLRLIIRITKNPSASEDILQETFARVWNESGKIQENATQVGPWIFTIARNRALDYLRAPQQWRSVAQPIGEELESSLISGEDSAEENLISEESRRRVTEALQNLDARHKQVIELAYYGGLSHSQIAEQLNQPLGTVKSWTRSALITLRSALKER